MADVVPPSWWAESVEEGREAEAKTVPPHPDAVRVLAEAMHKVQCLPGANPYHRFSDGHRGPELRRAGLILAAAAESAGYVLVRREATAGGLPPGLPVSHERTDEPCSGVGQVPEAGP